MQRRLYRDIFGIGSESGSRFIEDYDRLTEIVTSLRTIDPQVKVVLVLGTYDLLHIGHARYLEQCREHGDVVIVAVDPDDMVKCGKGPNRPVVPEQERIEMLTHLRHVDLVTMVKDYNEKGLWTYGLIKDYFQPDVVVVSQREPTDEIHIATVEKYCRKVVVLKSQAPTSTSAKIRLLMMDFAQTIKAAIEAIDIPGTLARAIDTQLETGPRRETLPNKGEETNLEIPQPKPLSNEKSSTQNPDFPTSNQW